MEHGCGEVWQNEEYLGGKGVTPTPEDETIYKYNIERVLDTDIRIRGMDDDSRCQESDKRRK